MNPDRELERLIRLFLKAETDIINEIGRLRSIGNVDYHAQAALERVQAILRKLENDAWEYVPAMVERHFYAHHPEARRILGESGEKHLRAYKAAETLTSEQMDLAQRLTQSLMGEITDAAITAFATVQSALIGRVEPDVYRRIGMEQVALRTAEGRGVYKQLPAFVEALRREGVTAFVDKAGRRWSLHTYCSMVSRTTARQAETLAVLSADNGQDLYRISQHNTACALCAPFEGRVYSKSGTDPDFPPLADAFGKQDPAGPDILANTWLNIHPNCLHSITPWTPAGRSKQELEEIKLFSSPKTNPYSRDPRSRKQVEAYRRKEKARTAWLQNYRQWERYRMTLGDLIPKTFKTWQAHKIAGDAKYKEWQRLFRRENKRLSFQPLIGQRTATGIEITGISSHILDQAVTRGFTAEGILDALQNPKKIGKLKTDAEGRRSIQFIGETAAAVINPETGNLTTGWKK